MIGFFRRYVFQNFLLKLVSLVIAVLLWMSLAQEPSVEVAVTAPIEFHHVPDALEIVTDRIPDAQIRVRGPSNVVRGLQLAEVRAVVDLSTARPGERTYDLTSSQVRVPPDLEVVQVVPSQLHLAFDRQSSRQVPIRPRITGVYGSGTAPTITVDPPTATIIGPEKRVQGIDAVYTDAVDLAGAMHEGTFNGVHGGVHIYVTDPLVRVARPQSVSVTVSTSTSGNRAAHSHSDPDQH